MNHKFKRGDIIKCIRDGNKKDSHVINSLFKVIYMDDRWGGPNDSTTWFMKSDKDDRGCPYFIDPDQEFILATPRESFLYHLYGSEALLDESNYV